MSRLEVHHIFPKAQLYKLGHKRPDVNALANFCFLTKETNLKISDHLPEMYFPEVDAKYPGSLASQWIPMDPNLWRVENYLDFLTARRKLLAEETNERMLDLLHGDTRWLEGSASPVPASTPVIGGITTDDEEAALTSLNNWVESQGLPRGQLALEYTDTNTGEQRAVLDLAWPDGMQEGLSEPVAVLLTEGTDVLMLANSAGYRCFTSIGAFKAYVSQDVVGEGTGRLEVWLITFCRSTSLSI